MPRRVFPQAKDEAVSAPVSPANAPPPLPGWMTYLLRFAACYNLLAGFSIACLYHENFRFLGVEKPRLLLFVQLTGVLVALFGVGYWLVARDPRRNANLLVLGWWSKALGSALGLWYVGKGQLPPVFVAILFVSDIIYLFPFWLILRRLGLGLLPR